MKENIDYHIKPVGKTFELSSVILPGFVAGVVDLTARGYKLNFNTVNFVGNLMVVNTMPKTPKTPKPVKKPKKTPKIKEKDESKKNNK